MRYYRGNGQFQGDPHINSIGCPHRPGELSPRINFSTISKKTLVYCSNEQYILFKNCKIGGHEHESDNRSRALDADGTSFISALAVLDTKA